MADTLIESVSDTAFWIAHYRAIETKRRDALFRDPLAGVLAGDRGEKIARAMPMSFWTSWSVVMRTCIIDDFIRSAIAEGVDTVLNLGAGLDTRPYRMDLPPSLVWFEADYPRLIEYKAERLAGETPRCRLERMKLDLSDAVERRPMLAGIDARGTKIVVLTEGVVPYLSEAEVGSLAADLRTMDHVRYWIAEYLAPEIVKYRNRGLMRRSLQNAPFKFETADWLGFFRRHGWCSKEIRYLVEEAERFNRPIQLPPILRVLLTIRGVWSSPEKREAYRKLAGYAMLERAV
ncbi:MAG TPA: SAM-dependent methyltransferase [Candidatus Acidoferrales bacterium]|nr:SAM-dependent methyltransferase [Candidatus Acidoferrales bacterium]